MKKLINFLFICLIVSTILSYFPQAVISIVYNKPLVSSITYSNVYISAGLPIDFPLIRFLKDIINIILFICILIDRIFISQKISKKVLWINVILFLILLPLSIISLMFSEEFNLLMIIAGLRIILFLITNISYCFHYLDKAILEKIDKMITKIVIIETIIVFLHMLICMKYYGLFNVAKLRLIGTFSSCGLLGLFGIGYLFFSLLIKESKVSYISIKHRILFTGFIIVCSGTRIAMVCYMITIFTYFYTKYINKNNTKILTILFLFFSLISGIVFLNISEKIADRGSAIAVQLEGGRIDFIIDYLQEASLKELLIGTGIGFGTNNALSLLSNNNIQSETRVMDGTFNILITQYGLIVTCVILIFVLWIFVIILLKSHFSLELKLIYIITTFLLLLVGNTLEQYNFQIFLIINTFILIKESEWREEND